MQSPHNPERLPIDVFDGLRANLFADRPQFYQDLAQMFYGANRAGAKVSKGTLDQFWLWSMQAGLLNAYESIKAFSETDFRDDLAKFGVPTLVLHGEDAQIVPVKDSAHKRVQLVANAQEIYYPEAPHALRRPCGTRSTRTCSRSCGADRNRQQRPVRRAGRR